MEVVKDGLRDSHLVIRTLSKIPEYANDRPRRLSNASVTLHVRVLLRGLKPMCRPTL